MNFVDFIKINGSIRNINYKHILTNYSQLQVSNIPLFNNVIFENQIDEKALYSQFMTRALNDAQDIIDIILKSIKRT